MENEGRKYFTELMKKIKSGEQLDDKQKKFLEGLKKLKSSKVPKKTPEVSDLMKKVQENRKLPKPSKFVEEVTGGEFQKKIGEKTKSIDIPKEINFNKLRREAMEKSSDIAKTGRFKKIAKKIGGKALKFLPIATIGASLLANGKVEASDIPVLNDIDPIGAEPGTLENKLEQGTITPEERLQLMKRNKFDE